MGWLKDAYERGDGLNRTGIETGQFHFMSWGNAKDADKGISQLWWDNAEKNLKFFDKHKRRKSGMSTGLESHENDCIIFVGASPILKESVKYLKGLHPRFKICATNSSIGYLVENGVIPHYCILVDGNPGKWTWEMRAIRESCRDTVGLFAIAAYPEEVSNWPGKFVIIPYNLENPKLMRKVWRRYGCEHPVGGGNALNCAVALFVQFTRCTMFLFAGNELSFSDKYYVQGDAISDGKPYVFATNIYGEEVRTLVNLWEYKLWLENFINSFAMSHYFCDCSEGMLGVESDGSLMPFLDHKTLPDAIRDVEEAWKMEEATAEEKNKAIYQELYENHDYHPTLGASYWAQLTAGANLDMMESEGIRKILDFGCGTGEGVRVLRNMGYDAYGVDISSNTKAWMENNVTLYCGSYDGRRTKHEDNEFDMVGCFEVMEHIPEELAEQTLREIYRIGNKHFAFTIALQEEAALIYGKLSFHVNLKPVEWWIDLLERIGFNLVNANEQIYNRVDGRPYSTLFVFASKTNSNLRCEAKWDDKCQTSNAPL